MEKEISIIKEKLENLVSTSSVYLILVKKFIKRREFVFVIGKSDFSKKETVYEDEKYVLISENLNNELKEKALDIIKNISTE